MALLSVQPEILVKYWHQIRRKRGFDFLIYLFFVLLLSLLKSLLRTKSVSGL